MSQIKNSESSKGKERSDKGTPIKLLVDFSIETFQSRSQLDDIVKILKEKKTVHQEFHTHKMFMAYNIIAILMIQYWKYCSIFKILLSFSSYESEWHTVIM